MNETCAHGKHGTIGLPFRLCWAREKGEERGVRCGSPPGADAVPAFDLIQGGITAIHLQWRVHDGHGKAREQARAMDRVDSEERE